jgi:hypothetical protein
LWSNHLFLPELIHHPSLLPAWLISPQERSLSLVLYLQLRVCTRVVLVGRLHRRLSKSDRSSAGLNTFLRVKTGHVPQAVRKEIGGGVENGSTPFVTEDAIREGGYQECQHTLVLKRKRSGELHARSGMHLRLRLLSLAQPCWAHFESSSPGPRPASKVLRRTHPVLCRLSAHVPRPAHLTHGRPVAAAHVSFGLCPANGPCSHTVQGPGGAFSEPVVVQPKHGSPGRSPHTSPPHDAVDYNFNFNMTRVYIDKF